MPNVHFTNRGEINRRFAMLDFTGVVLESSDEPNKEDGFHWRLTKADDPNYFCEGEASGAFADQPDTTGCDASGVWQFNPVGARYADGWYCTACVLEMLANDDMRVVSGAITVKEA